MNLENSHYDAFISYRHSELDKFVAENIHHELEKIKFPKKLIKEGKGNGKRKINRVFRDQEELPLTSDLAEPITNALRNSEYLIVICSPRLPESIWCRREVETFIEFHGREKVFAVLVEGRAHESFPDSILWAEQVVRDQNGFIRIERNPVEPLAADVRGKDKKEVKKKIKSEVLRLAAPMFDVSFDDLKQRHREQKMRRLMTFSIAASTIFLTFGAISTTMALLIKNQSKKIQTQSEELQVQYDAAMKNQANLVAAEAQELIDEGKRKEAVKKLLTVMPATKDGDEQIPYTASTENALGQALFAYESGFHQRATSTLQMDADAEYVEVSPEGDRILSIDDKKNIYIWDTATGECTTRLNSDEEIEESPSGGISEAVFTDNSHIMYDTSDGYILYNLDEEKVDVRYKSTNDFEVLFKSYLDQGRDYVVFDDLYQYYVFRISTGELLAKLSVAEKQSTSGCFSFSEDGSVLVYTTHSGSLSQIIESHIIAVDTHNWNVINDMAIPYSRIWDIKIFHGNAVLIANGADPSIPLYDPDYDFIAYDIVDGSQQWARKCDWGIPSNIYGISEWENHLIAVECTGTVVTLNSDTGEVNGVMTTGKKMLVCEPSDRVEGAFLLISEDGEVYDYLADLQTYRESIRIFMHEAPIEQISKTDTVMATIAEDSPEITVYQYQKGDKTELAYEFEQSITGVDYNAAMDRLIVKTYGDNVYRCYLFDLDTVSLIKEVELEDDSQYFTTFFAGAGDDKFAVIDTKVHYYSTKDGTPLETKDFVDENGEEIDTVFAEIHMDTQKKTISFIQNGNLYIYDSSNMERIYLSSEDFSSLSEEGFEDTEFDISDGMKYFAYNDEEKQQIDVYDLEDSSLYVSVPVNSSYVTYIFFDETSSRLFVSFKDGDLNIYNLPDGSLMKSLNLNTCVSSGQSLRNGTGMALYGGELYIVDENFDVRTTVSDYLFYDDKNNVFYACWYQFMSKTPAYTYEELQEAARTYKK